MNVSTTQNPSWKQRMEQGQNKPRPMDLRVSDASKVQARPVSLGRAITKSLEYMRDHPVDFVISVGTFIAAKALVTMAFPVLAGIAAAMLTAGILGVGRSLNQETRARTRRVDQLYKRTDNPTPEDLAKAKHIDMAGVIETGFKRAALTGIIGSVTGIFLTSLFENVSFGGSHNYSDHAYGTHTFNVPGDVEYQKFLEDLADDESRASGLYQAENSKHFVGKYQFGEPAMVETGYYSWTDESGTPVDKTNWRYTKGMEWTKVNSWEGMWTEKAQALGINSTEDFKNNPAVQEQAVRELMQSNWEDIIYYELDDYIGQTFEDRHGNSFKVTPGGLLRGAHLGGVGGVKTFLEHGGIGDWDASDGRTRVSDYMFAGEKFNVPFEAGTKTQIPYHPPHSADCLSGISHTWPVDPNVTVTTGSEYGMRMHPVHHVMKLHTGLDIRAAAGTDVLASADGVVHQVNRGWNGGWGNQIVLQHADGNFSLYNHLSNIQVFEGSKVIMGQDIGGVGTTGVSTGNHLHYELRADSDGNGKYSGSLVDKSYDPKACITDESGKGRVLVNTYIASNAPSR
ncbi:MAG: M23 family metallopeptidase [Rickettsiales bacterium]|nr:M23 family metallopeptidase [Rickettsiales bacterium]